VFQQKSAVAFCKVFTYGLKVDMDRVVSSSSVIVQAKVIWTFIRALRLCAYICEITGNRLLRYDQATVLEVVTCKIKIFTTFLRPRHRRWKLTALKHFFANVMQMFQHVEQTC